MPGNGLGACSNASIMEARKGLTGEGHRIKFVDFGFERKQVVGFWEGTGR